jgi:transcriptional regulator with XRE-family HTH domain
MNLKASSDERESFSQRLTDALRMAGCSPRSPDVATEFNLRAEGGPVTPFAVRKWLNGEAIPTQEKLVVLAKWLGVSAHWLRFGEGAPPAPVAANDAKGLGHKDRILLRDLHRLDDKSLQIVRGLVQLLLKNRPDK